MQLPYAIKNRLPTITRVMRINKKMENKKVCFIRIICLHFVRIGVPSRSLVLKLPKLKQTTPPG